MFTKQLETWQFEWWRRKIQTNVNEKAILQGNLMPIQLWDYKFPKENLDLVLSTINPNREFEGPQKHLNKYASWTRMLLGAKKIPEINPKGPIKAMTPTPNVQRLGIGIKEDLMGDLDGYHQELI